MHSFTDSEGREWKIKLSTLWIARVKEGLDVQLLALGDNNFQLLRDLYFKPELLVSILWILLERQTKKHALLDDDESSAMEKFAEGIGGNVLTAARTALVGAVEDFFENQGEREAVRAFQEATQKILKMTNDEMTEKIKALDLNQLVTNSFNSALSSPPLPESTPGATPLAS